MSQGKRINNAREGIELSVSTIATLDDAARVVELSRMLSGQPESETARRHAEELLSLAGADRGRS